MHIRIIPRLDIKGPNLVKGIHLEGLRVLGSPEEFACFYYKNGADELFYQDVVASLYDRNSLDEIITRTSESVFIPLTVGGGLRDLNDITRVLRAGADKVALNTAVLKCPSFIDDAVKAFGSSTIMIAIEAIRHQDGKYFAYTDNGREYTGVNVIDWAKEVQERGAGEICITSVDREGTGLGFDIELIKQLTAISRVPIIAHGGCGNEFHAVEAVESGGVDAVALASVLHYDLVKILESKNTPEIEGNREFLKRGGSYNRVTPTSLSNIKKKMNEYGISVRIESEY